MNEHRETMDAGATAAPSAVPSASAPETAEPQVVHDTAAHRYRLDLGGGAVAVADYVPMPGGVVFTHTYVPSAFEGQGVGSQLVAGALDDARRRGWKVIARCWFVADYLRSHPEYADLVARPGG